MSLDAPAAARARCEGYLPALVRAAAADHDAQLQYR
jgi:hypothetical protein